MNIKIIGILAAVIGAPAFAEDVVEEIVADTVEVVDEGATTEVPAPRAVVERLSCDEINERVAELREDVKSYPDLAADLEYMVARQRTQCATRANRRPVHNYQNVNPAVVVEETEIEEEETAEEQVESEAPVVVEAAPVVEKTPEELAAAAAVIEENRAKGLCDDGNKPNRFGCCAGEKFKEVSQMQFACCPKTGDGECVEPRRK